MKGKLKEIIKEFGPKYQGLDGEYYSTKKDWWFFSKLYTGHGSKNIVEPNWKEINFSKSPVLMQKIFTFLLEKKL